MSDLDRSVADGGCECQGKSFKAGRMVEMMEASILTKGGGEIANLRCDSMPCMNGKV